MVLKTLFATLKMTKYKYTGHDLIIYIVKLHISCETMYIFRYARIYIVLKNDVGLKKAILKII